MLTGAVLPGYTPLDAVSCAERRAAYELQRPALLPFFDLGPLLAAGMSWFDVNALRQTSERHEYLRCARL